MPQQIAIFDGYGELERLETKLNAWLHAEPRHVLSMQANESRLFIRWRKGNEHHRREPAYIKILSTLTNGSTPEARFREFFEEHPTANIQVETCNEFFLFWLWVDET